MRSSIKPAAYAPALTRGEDWTAQGLCGDPKYRPTENDDPWYSTNPVDQNYAKAICGHCPVKQRCAEAGRDEQYGIWGGIVRTKTKKPTGPVCQNCDRPIRPKGARLEDYPGTLAGKTSTTCHSCYREGVRTGQDRIIPGQPCAGCETPVYPRRHDRPEGTRRHMARGLCTACYRKWRREAGHK